MDMLSMTMPTIHNPLWHLFHIRGEKRSEEKVGLQPTNVCIPQGVEKQGGIPLTWQGHFCKGLEPYDDRSTAKTSSGKGRSIMWVGAIKTNPIKSMKGCHKKRSWKKK